MPNPNQQPLVLLINEDRAHTGNPLLAKPRQRGVATVVPTLNVGQSGIPVRLYFFEPDPASAALRTVKRTGLIELGAKAVLNGPRLAYALLGVAQQDAAGDWYHEGVLATDSATTVETVTVVTSVTWEVIIDGAARHQFGGDLRPAVMAGDDVNPDDPAVGALTELVNSLSDSAASIARTQEDLDDAAQTIADNQTAAVDAASTAVAARDDAESARDTATTAKNDAVAAKVAAESARDTAVTKAGEASAAADDAAADALAANAAKTAAESARDTAVAAKNEAVATVASKMSYLEVANFAALPSSASATQIYRTTTDGRLWQYRNDAWRPWLDPIGGVRGGAFFGIGGTQPGGCVGILRANPVVAMCWVFKDAVTSVSHQRNLTAGGGTVNPGSYMVCFPANQRGVAVLEGNGTTVLGYPVVPLPNGVRALWMYYDRVARTFTFYVNDSEVPVGTVVRSHSEELAGFTSAFGQNTGTANNFIGGVEGFYAFNYHPTAAQRYEYNRHRIDPRDIGGVANTHPPVASGDFSEDAVGTYEAAGGVVTTTSGGVLEVDGTAVSPPTLTSAWWTLIQATDNVNLPPILGGRTIRVTADIENRTGRLQFMATSGGGRSHWLATGFSEIPLGVSGANVSVDVTQFYGTTSGGNASGYGVRFWATSGSKFRVSNVRAELLGLQVAFPPTAWGRTRVFDVSGNSTDGIYGVGVLASEPVNRARSFEVTFTTGNVSAGTQTAATPTTTTFDATRKLAALRQYDPVTANLVTGVPGNASANLGATATANGTLTLYASALASGTANFTLTRANIQTTVS